MNPFKIDWNNKDAVIAFAKTLGTNICVIKYHDRDNYNISRFDGFIKSDEENVDLIWSSDDCPSILENM